VVDEGSPDKTCITHIREKYGRENNIRIIRMKKTAEKKAQERASNL
jgi:hypothetical protein